MPASTVICVLGMHRSGTSTVTRVLDDLGVYLGPAHHLMKPRADNPVGFYEHQLLTDRNDEILWELRGSWFNPPSMPEGWIEAPVLAPIRSRAVEVLAEDFGGRELVGWKDPRTCLTLPFWRPLLGSVRAVLVIRHPSDIARSLQAREGFSLEASTQLWFAYMSAALRHTADIPRLVVRYDDLLDDPDREVPRLARFVGCPDDSLLVPAAAAHAAEHSVLRHHRTADRGLPGFPSTTHAASALWEHLLLERERQRAGAPGQVGQGLPPEASRG
ncbi:MAG: sulfotransferase [Vicinamibacterales bacterium]